MLNREKKYERIGVTIHQTNFSRLSDIFRSTFPDISFRCVQCTYIVARTRANIVARARVYYQRRPRQVNYRERTFYIGERKAVRLDPRARTNYANRGKPVLGNLALPRCDDAPCTALSWALWSAF